MNPIAVIRLMAAEFEAQTVVAEDAVKADVVLRAVDVAVLEGALLAIGVLVLKVPAALMCDTDLDAVLAVAAAVMMLMTPETARSP